MIRNVQGVVLWSRRSRDADKLVGLYTDTLGKVTARAISAARPPAKFSSLTEPFALSEVALYLVPGQGWGKIVGGQLIRTFPRLRTDLQLSTAASWICEVMARLTPEEQPGSDKFLLLVEALDALEEATSLGMLRLAFTLRFLDFAGFGLENRDAWQHLAAAHPDWAHALINSSLRDLTVEKWTDPMIGALEQLAGGVVLNQLNRPLSVNRFRQMTGVEI